MVMERHPKDGINIKRQMLLNFQRFISECMVGALDPNNGILQAQTYPTNE